MFLQAATMQVELDEETGLVNLSWLNSCPPDNPNPVMWVPDKRVSVTLSQEAVVTDLNQPQQLPEEPEPTAPEPGV